MGLRSEMDGGVPWALIWKFGIISLGRRKNSKQREMHKAKRVYSKFSGWQVVYCAYNTGCLNKKLPKKSGKVGRSLEDKGSCFMQKKLCIIFVYPLTNRNS